MEMLGVRETEVVEVTEEVIERVCLLSMHKQRKL